MHSQTFDYTKYQPALMALFTELAIVPAPIQRTVAKLVKKYPKAPQEYFTKDELVMGYRGLTAAGDLTFNDCVMHAIQMKPTRTISGVTPVTVLTKPFPCPGKCIFCPNDIRMPKSYLADEPGAQRAERNAFDPYLQTYNRLLAFQNTGHHTDKVEFIILGGTWSYYPQAYQIWFIKECFRALNDFSEHVDHRSEREIELVHMRETVRTTHDQKKNDTQTYNQIVSEMYVGPEMKSGIAQKQTATWDELKQQQRSNETARCRNVGLVIETRPDNISEAEVMRIRKLGCTKTQIGFQSLNDDVLAKNHRGHDVAETRRAVGLLRRAGFKIHAHWMPNLFGSTPELDQHDYDVLFGDDDFKPDELKIYPCSLIESAELMEYYRRGEWHPYSEAELLAVLSYCMVHTPEYCRLTRVIRDIPSTDIVTGNLKTNFRQIVEAELEKIGQRSKDIRAREVRGRDIDPQALKLSVVKYQTSVSTEYFLQYCDNNKLAAFLRLSLPKETSFIPELGLAAIIREVHVYGQAQQLGTHTAGKAQHAGLGTLLIEKAKEIAGEHNREQLAVISAVGTREYYRKRGFRDGELYQFLEV